MRRAQPPRVLHVAPAVFGSGGEIGGGERYAHELARAMSARVPTRLVSFGASERRWRDGDLPVRVLPRTRYVAGSRFNPVSPDLASEVLQADVVHVHQQHILASTLSAMLGRLAGRVVAVTDHGGGGLDLSRYVSTDRLYHHHLRVSAFSRSQAGLDGCSRARVILGGVDVRRFTPCPREARTSRAMFVGRVLPHKGVHDLVDALPPRVGLDVVGPATDGAYLDALKSLAAGRDVAFVGVVTEDELVRRYRRALCVVLPSVHRSRYGATTSVPELLGQTLLEGMACGTPAVASRVGGLPETIVDGVTGYLVPAGDPDALRSRVARLASDPDLCARMGRAAALHVRRNFHWDGVVDRCLEAYGGR